MHSEHRPRPPPQVSPSLSASLNLVPRMEGCKFLDLVHKVVQPLPVLVLKGVQLGQPGLRLHSHPVWYSRHGCSPVLIFADWRFLA